MPSDLMDFADAVEKARKLGLSPSVLLGNGFSMDFNAKIFGYDSLSKEAKLDGLSTSKKALFETLDSTNFEVIVEKLRTAADLADLYGGKKSLVDQLRDDADVVQNGLADVLAERHPEHAYVLGDDEVRHARVFLSNFDRIYTLSYDLLLYWVVNRASVGYTVPQSDGFEFPTYHDRPYLIWKSQPQTAQRVYYLHGALHLYVEEKRVRKLSYNIDGRLVEEMRSRLEAGRYPLIVTEGKTEEKLARIDRSAYLRTAHRRFAQLEGALFVHGFSFSDMDEHVIEPLEAPESEIEALFVGIHGSLTRGSGRRIKNRVEDVQENRHKAKGKPLDVYFYDTKTAHVWR